MGFEPTKDKLMRLVGKPFLSAIDRLYAVCRGNLIVLIESRGFSQYPFFLTDKILMYGVLYRHEVIRKGGTRINALNGT